MPAFPLQELPFVALSHQLKCMSIHDLLNISKDSSRMQRIIKDIGIRSGGYNIEIDGFGWMLNMVNECYGTNWNETDKLDTIGTLIGSFEHIQRLFPGPTNTLTVCQTMSESLMVFEPFLPKEYNLLIVKSEFDSERFWDFEPEDSEKQRKEEEQKWLDQFLGSTNFKYGIILQGPGRPKTELDKITHKDFLKVDYSDWVTIDQLALLQNRMIYLDRSMFSNEAMHDFLKKFKTDAGNQRLEILTVQGYDEDPEWNETEILEGLGAKRWSPEEPSERFFINETNKTKLSIISEHFQWNYDPKCGINLESAQDFICDDGTLCSVLFNGNKMQLFVWRKESLEKDEGKEGRKRRMVSDDASEAKRRRAD